ncbi:hypothetical protein GGR53DRAFT_197286 [Hypoxylon sp. FL1150]|nr:hypothetical protein GGR53DRAFT_197286 [Hypoxylon sp. FL1150]
MSEESDISDAEDGVSSSSLYSDLIDDEAIECDDESDESDDDREPIVPFPQFMRLPPELRERVWEFFNPDLKMPRVFRLLHIDKSPSELWESGFLDQQTAPARAMLATYSESRAIAMKHYPHILKIRGGRGILRFHGEKDVILLDPPMRPSRNPNAFAKLLKDVQYIGFDAEEPLAYPISEMLPPSVQQHLKAVFMSYPWDYYRKAELAWCVSDWVHRNQNTGIEDTDYSSTEFAYMFCWPNLPKHEALASRNVLPAVHHAAGVSVPIWPMIEFSDFSDTHDRLVGIPSYQGVCDFVSHGGDDSSALHSGSENESADSDTEDEYESSGIDDATIDSNDDASEDEDDFTVLSGSEEEEYEEEVSFNGFSPIQDEEPELHSGDGVEAANFSSLEPESPEHDGSESSSDVSDEEPVRKTGRNKRRIVSSDDEDDDEDDAEEEGGDKKIPSRPAKRTRIVVSDSEDADEDEDEENHEENHEENGRRVAKGRGRRIIVHDSDDDESEDEEPMKAKPMSIFQKLSQFRDDNPVSPGSNDDSDSEGSMTVDELNDDGGFDDDDGGIEDTFDDGDDAAY